MCTCIQYALIHMQTLAAMLVTSPELLEMVTPFSLGMLLELLLGELGPDPGALLHADSKTHIEQKLVFSNMLPCLTLFI